MGIFGFVGDGVKWVGKQVFGGSEDPGLLGAGQYKYQERELDPAAAKIGGAEQMRQTYSEGAMGAANRAAPGMAAARIDTAPQAEFRQGQANLAAALAAQARGEGPSLAQGQLKQATDRNLAQALAMQASQRGPGSATALRQIANQRAAIGQQAASDSAQLRLAEQLQAQQQLSGVLQGARGQDLGLASDQAALESTAGQANLQAALTQRQMNDQAVQQYLNLGFNLAQAEQKAAMDLERLRLEQEIQKNAIQSGAYAQTAQRRQGVVEGLVRVAAGGATGGAGAAGGAAAAPAAP